MQLFLGPDHSLHGRESRAARSCFQAPLPVNSIFSADVGLLKKEKRGNQLLYSANRASTVFGQRRCCGGGRGGMAAEWTAV